MAAGPSTSCWYCKGNNPLVFEPEDMLWWCRDCGRPNTQNQVDPEIREGDFLCPECGDDLDVLENGTQRHSRDLPAPKCTRHKAELINRRRTELKLVRGGRYGDG